MKRALCVWLPHWSLQRLLRERPGLKGEAVVLFEEGGREGRRVVDRSRRSAALGIAPGMPVAEATALADASCELVLEPIDRARDAQTLERLGRWLQRFSPIVGLEESSTPESLLLDVTGCAPAFGGESALVAEVEQAMRQAGWRARGALADAVGPAWALAHHRSALATTFVICPPGESLAWLRPLPIAALRLSAGARRALHELGIDRIVQLERTGRACWESRLGPELLQRWRQAIGEEPETIAPIPPPPMLEARTDLESPLDRWATLGLILDQHVATLLEELGRGLGIGRLEVELTREGNEPIGWSVGLLAPTADGRRLRELLRHRLDRLPALGAIVGVRTRAALLAPLPGGPRELFDDEGAQERRRQFSQWIERLSSRLGAEAVARVRWTPDAQPELAFAYEPWLGEARRPANEPRLFPPGLRPMRLLPQPEAVEAMSLAPDGPPIQFVWRGESHRVLHAWGPERVETGWWREAPARRDYYRAQTTVGQRCWLFRRLEDGQWFLHGWFD